MKKILLLIFVMAFVTEAAVTAQNKINSPWLSGYMGTRFGNALSTTRDGDSFGLNFGAGFGVPLFLNFAWYNKVTYQTQSEFSAYDEIEYMNAELELVNETVPVDASFSQLLINTGVQYSIYFSDSFSLGINAGLTYSLVKSEAHTKDGRSTGGLDNTGIFGYFSGVGLEKHFIDSNFSTLLEAQYNYLSSESYSFHEKFSGMSLAIGMRYYFSQY